MRIFLRISVKAVEQIFPESFGHGGRADISRKFRQRRTRGYFLKFGHGERGGYFFGAGAAAVFKSLDKAFCIIL